MSPGYDFLSTRLLIPADEDREGTRFACERQKKQT